MSPNINANEQPKAAHSGHCQYGSAPHSYYRQQGEDIAGVVLQPTSSISTYVQEQLHDDNDFLEQCEQPAHQYTGAVKNPYRK